MRAMPDPAVERARAERALLEACHVVLPVLLRKRGFSGLAQRCADAADLRGAANSIRTAAALARPDEFLAATPCTPALRAAVEALCAAAAADAVTAIRARTDGAWRHVATCNSNDVFQALATARACEMRLAATAAMTGD